MNFYNLSEEVLFKKYTLLLSKDEGHQALRRKCYHEIR